MTTRDVFSLLLRVVNILTLDNLYLQNVLILLYILLNTEAASSVKILLDATFSVIPLKESFLCERIHSKKLYENYLYHFFLVALMFICK